MRLALRGVNKKKSPKSRLRQGWRVEYRFSGWVNGITVSSLDGVWFRVTYLGVYCGKKDSLPAALEMAETLIQDNPNKLGSYHFTADDTITPGARWVLRKKKLK